MKNSIIIFLFCILFFLLGSCESDNRIYATEVALTPYPLYLSPDIIIKKLPLKVISIVEKEEAPIVGVYLNFSTILEPSSFLLSRLYPFVTFNSYSFSLVRPYFVPAVKIHSFSMMRSYYISMIHPYCSIHITRSHSVIYPRPHSIIYPRPHSIYTVRPHLIYQRFYSYPCLDVRNSIYNRLTIRYNRTIPNRSTIPTRNRPVIRRPATPSIKRPVTKFSFSVRPTMRSSARLSIDNRITTKPSLSVRSSVPNRSSTRSLIKRPSLNRSKTSLSTINRSTARPSIRSTPARSSGSRDRTGISSKRSSSSNIRSRRK